MSLLFFGTAVFAASTGSIDPNNSGAYKAAFLDNSVVSDTSINFGKFTTEAQYNITVSDTELHGYAWGSSVGWIVMNCAETTSGCSSNNGNFKVANNAGLLSGYAWGENTGWVNFGPFTNTNISTVKIGSNGNFGGTNGTAGYAWSQNYGWIVFDCTNNATCVNTNWSVTVSTGGGVVGGTGGSGNASSPNSSTAVSPSPDTSPAQNPAPTADQSTPPPSSPSTLPPEQPTQPPNVQPPVNPPTSDNLPISTSANNGSLPPLVFGNSFTVAAIGIVHMTAAAFGTIAPLAKGLLIAARSSTGTTVTKVIATTGAAITIAGGTTILLLANPFSFAELFLLLFRLWVLFLTVIGFKKRNRPWGTVYDSVTKQPIDPAYVVLTDMQGNEIATSITDINGRYGFFVPAGTYKILANKTNYEFPSKKLFGKVGDELYNGLYFGETLVIQEDGAVIAKNIPLDQLNFDWNEFDKKEHQRLAYYRRSDIIIARISNIFFWLGFTTAAVALLATHTLYNGLIFGLYFIMLLIRYYNPRFKPKGSITEATTSQPLSFAILHVLSASTSQEITHKVADRLGNYYCLIPNGTYNVVVDRKNTDATYTKIPVTESVTVKKGYLKKSFEI